MEHTLLCTRLPTSLPCRHLASKRTLIVHTSHNIRRRIVHTGSVVSAAAASGGDNAASTPHDQPAHDDKPTTSGNSFPLSNPKAFFTDGKSVKERLAGFGVGAFAAYGLVSNINAGVLITIAWVTVLKKTSKTPFQEGNWPLFLAVYAGLWVSSHFMRPIRLSIALGLAPAFNKAIENIQARTGQSKAIALFILFAGVAVSSLLFTGTSVMLFSALAMAPLPGLK
jgi:hypothetical protein